MNTGRFFTSTQGENKEVHGNAKRVINISKFIFKCNTNNNTNAQFISNLAKLVIIFAFTPCNLQSFSLLLLETVIILVIKRTQSANHHQH